jgi:hypothetical protein
VTTKCIIKWGRKQSTEFCISWRRSKGPSHLPLQLLLTVPVQHFSSLWG